MSRGGPVVMVWWLFRKVWDNTQGKVGSKSRIEKCGKGGEWSRKGGVGRTERCAVRSADRGWNLPKKKGTRVRKKRWHVDAWRGSI